MKETELIFNDDTSNHLEYLLKCFENADEVYIATAFFKMSGLNLLLPSIKKHLKASKSISIIAGQNFGLTDPEALRAIFTLFEEKVNANLFLDKAEQRTNIFHPKLFLFKSGEKGVIVSGSANITRGGLVTNREVSLASKTTITNKDWLEARNYFKQLTSLENAIPVSLLDIKRYEEYYKQQSEARKDQKPAPDKSHDEYSFDYEKLRIRLEKYRTEESKLDFKQREKDYEQAKLLLNEIAINEDLSQDKFEDIIDSLVGKKGQKSLWKSGSLHRHKVKVYACKKEFRDLVLFIKENQQYVPSKVFRGAKALVEKVKGAGVNYITEIMMTYQPKKFANLNANPIRVLKEEAGVVIKSENTSFNGEDYQEYCLLIQEISDELELKNMMEVDSFFNEIYWLLDKENN